MYFLLENQGNILNNFYLKTYSYYNFMSAMHSTFCSLKSVIVLAYLMHAVNMLQYEF